MIGESPGPAKKRPNGKGSISYDRRRKKWRVRLTSPMQNGKPKRRGWYANTEAEATELLSVLRGKSDAGELSFEPSGTRTAHIYFIQPLDGGPIKIGSAVDVQARFLDIQSCSPSILKVCAVICDKDLRFERELHKRFAHCRLHGEWFSPVSELLELIDDLQNSE